MLKVKPTLPFVGLMMLSILACAGEQQMGKLYISTPVKFEMRGETNHLWEVTVKPNTIYLVSIRAAHTSGIQVVVLSDGDELASASFYDQPPELTFTSLRETQVVLKVSTIGQVGEYEISITEQP